VLVLVQHGSNQSSSHTYRLSYREMVAVMAKRGAAVSRKKTLLPLFA
jgi:hypothetical protein